LYYFATSSHLAFGSEIKALLASGLVERQLDLDALGQFLAWEYVPAPKTLFSGVRKLKPATMLEINLDHQSMKSWEWWKLPQGEVARSGNSLPRTAGEWEEAIDAKLRECVQRQLVSDVPLGAFLSGGVDSSSVVSAMGRARTFSIGFEDPSYNETEWSKRVAQNLGVKHTVEIIQPQAGDLFENLMKFMDDPIGDFSIFPTYLISRLARGEVTVALTGDGGDEVFGGYETYIAQEKARMWKRVPYFLRKGLAEKFIEKLKPRPEKKGLINKAKRFVEGLQHEEALTHTRWRLFVGEALRQQLFTRHAQTELKTPVAQHILDLFDNGNGRSELDRSLYVDLKSYLADNCLVKVDRMSMGCSLEVRVPLLDHELVELAFCMPENLKVHRGKTKVLLKRVAARHVPRECVYRAKEGFSIPIKNWLQSEFRPMLEDLLAPDNLKKEGIFRVDAIERMKMEHMKRLANHSHVLWSLIVFQDWRRRWRV
jgi:asparagine synthase (glutamine-hydrolysing)